MPGGFRNRARGRRDVAGEHDDLDAERAQARDRGGRRCAQLVGDDDQPQRHAVQRQCDRCPALRQRGELFGADFCALRGQEIRRAEEDVAAADPCLHAAARDGDEIGHRQRRNA